MLYKIDIPGGIKTMANYTSIMEDLNELNEILVMDDFQWDMADVNSSKDNGDMDLVYATFN